jgi:neutral ceramidase
MSLRAAAVEVDITPPTLPIEKPGWIVKILADRVEDPIRAKVIVIESAGTRVGFISLDVLSIRWPEVDRIREMGAAVGIPKQNLLVAATHTHTGPAVSSPGLARRDENYVEFMVGRVGAALRQAVDGVRPATIAFGSTVEGSVSFIRRCILRDGSARTHPPPGPDILCPESVLDPQVAVIRIDDAASDTPIGMIVNFACHPVHGGGGTALSAGWPGVLSSELRKTFGDSLVTCFLNGALGDVHHQSTIVRDYVDTKENVGQAVARAALAAPLSPCVDDLSLSARTTTLLIPLRDIDGPFGLNMPRRQRFAPDAVYETLIERLRTKKAKRDHVLAEVQCLRLGDVARFVTLPCEPFSAIGIEIKLRSPMRNTLVAGCANGMIGYVPTEAAFSRGGYETTLSMGSKLDPSAARRLTEAAMELLSSV